MDAKTDPNFVVMARTDALANEGWMRRSTEPCLCEGRRRHDLPRGDHRPADVQEIRRGREGADLANITEFGKSPLFTVDELRSADVAMILYPLTRVPRDEQGGAEALRERAQEGTQKGVLGEMQTREELYDVINYHSYEKKLDELFTRGRS
jgi:methylisocitrate lyase